MNILILENLDRLEFELSAYIREKFEDDDVEILYRVSDLELDVIKEAVSKADVICFQTMMQENSEKILNDISLLLLRMKWFKEVRVLHGGQHFCDILNFRIDSAVKVFIKDLMSFGLIVKEIFYEEYEDLKSNRQYFKKFNYFFDEVEIKIYKEIEETFFISQRIPYIKTFRKSCYELQPFFCDKEDLKVIPDALIDYHKKKIGKVKKEIKELTFKKEFGNDWEDFLDEIEAVFEYRIGGKFVDEEFNNKCLQIIDKLRKL